jgi:cell division protein FtsN
VDPTGRNGVFFEIVRSGKPSKDSDTVRPLMETRGDGAKMLVFNKLANDQLKHALEVLPDLNDLMNENRLRPDQIQALVDLDKAGGGQSDPDEVDTIFEINKAKEEVVEDEPDWVSGNVSSSTVAPAEQPKPAVPVAEPPKPAVPVAEPPKPEVKAEAPKPTEKPADVKPAPVEPVTVNGADVPATQWNDLWT